MKNINFNQIGHFLETCEKIENCFEFTYPEHFDAYFHNRLHGRYHVWNVLKWSLRISTIAEQLECLDPGEIETNDFIAANLLHDIAGLNIMKDERADHHIRSEPYIKKIIAYADQTGIDLFNSERVFIIARAHRLRNAFPPESVCEEIIALADGLDESIHRLYIGNKGRRPFFDETIPMEHRMKVVMRRNLEDEGISREDARNDALMFMLDSLVRNSLDFNPWRLVLSEEQSVSLRISDDCYAAIGRQYFDNNLSQLKEILRFEHKTSLFELARQFLLKVSEQDNFKILQTYQIQ